MKAEALQQALADIAAEHSPATLACSLQAEDLVIVDAIARARLPLEVYDIDVRVFAPDPAAVADYVHAHGRDGFYSSVELRQRCCEIRKVEPLARALAGKRAWITGQRREQAASRSVLAEREFDALHGLEKFNPLAAWSEAEVWQYVRANRVPYNRLYDQGYRSIGC